MVTAWVLLPQVGNVPLWCSALAAGVLGWRGWLALQNRPLPGKWWLMGLLALTIAATMFSYRTLLGREAGVTLLVVLLTLKTLELRARRDAFVVFFLGFFCMLSNFFYSQSLLTAFSMLVGLMGLLTVLVNAHMPVGRPPLLDALKTAGWMTLLGAPIMLVMFLLFPRMAPLWGLPSDAMTGRSGLSPNMRVGTMARLALDDGVAMRIKFEGPTPPQAQLYFRGPVLSDFDGLEWRSSKLDFASRNGVKSNLRVTGEPVRYEVTMEPSNRPWLMLLESTPVSPDLPNYQSAMQEDLQWLTIRPVTDIVRFKATSYPNFQHGPTTPAPGLREFVDLPLGFNPRTQALANQIKADPRNTSTALIVSDVMNRLRTGGYVYTLEPGEYGPNTADEFLFDKKEGFCEHIASSFVILMRAMNVPSRIVTGYQGGELNAVDGYWTVRQADAHAWAEVWHEGAGWVRVDPTSAVSPGRTGAFERLAAPRSVVAQALGNLSPGLSAQLRATWEAVNNGWNQWVLSYTQGKQLNLLKTLGFSAPSWHELGYLLIGTIVLASLLGAAWTLWERAQHDPWLRLLGRARKQLARLGIHSSNASSPRQLAALVHARTNGQSTEASSAIQAWLMQLEAQRYALASHQSPERFKQLQRQFRGLVWRV
ncbi:MAG: DUF3488 domain-containing transglutaminase family protein [Polaromonas sp.]|nr:DUF3488 domain-containing transglutaminase family protein [Polaromonas sp.]